MPGAKSPADNKVEIDVDEFEGWLSDVHTAAAHLAGYYLALKVPGQPGETETSEKMMEKKQIDGEVGNATKEFYAVGAQLTALVDNVPAPKLARDYYSRALKNSLSIAGDVDPARLKQVAEGLLLTSADFGSSMATTAAMKEELLDRLDRSPRLGDCQVRFDVEAIRIPGSDASETAWLNTFGQLHTAWVRYLKDCVCAAFNPPCAPCEDAAVLLACLEVKDCQVVEICNLKRKFVLSGPALRYWLPPLNFLGDALQKLCCPDPICIEKEEDPANGTSRNVLADLRRYQTIKKMPGRINFSIFDFLCEPRKKRTSTLQGLPPQSPGVITRPFGQNRRLRDSPRSFGAEILRRTGMPALLLEQPFDLSSRIKDIVGSMKSEGLAMLVTEALKAHPGLAGEVMADMADEKVAAAVAKLSTSAAKDLKDVKRMMNENVELRKIIKEQGDRAKVLMNRVEKLEKGTPQ